MRKGRTMDRAAVQAQIETAFGQQAQKDRRVRNAYLLVHSDKLGIDLRVAEGQTKGVKADMQQPVYMASVGKLFTATIISILCEQGNLAFTDKISSYLDADLMSGLHVYKGQDYSNEIEIRHLLNQSSGLYDPFWPLLEQMLKEPTMRMTPRDAVIWGKENLEPKAKPGEKHYYTDTNYYLLGLIVESITERPFHEALHRHIFEPLGMRSAYMQGYSKPAVQSEYPLASYYFNDVEGSIIGGLPGIDYAGGGVVAVLDDYLTFMQALVQHKLIKSETLQRMMSDDYPSDPTIRYGYAIWKFTTIPILMPEKFNCWGCVGATGAFMFYHPRTQAYIIGSFNDTSCRSKALRFMISKIIKPLLKCE
jgi:D-alanyl-D-alanine carboxypeptidase